MADNSSDADNLDVQLNSLSLDPDEEGLGSFQDGNGYQNAIFGNTLVSLLLSFHPHVALVECKFKSELRQTIHIFTIQILIRS